MRKFWNWVKNETDPKRTLRLEGIIAEETWWGDEITPAMFREELMNGAGDIDVYINSPGGDCVAASQIYAMLSEYKGKVTVKIDGMAASAASVVAMAGDEVLMFPAAMMMIHNPATIAWGDSAEIEKTIGMLDEFKEAIINAYEKKTGQPRVKISHWMDSETWMNANKAIELGFADGVAAGTAQAAASAVAIAPMNYEFSYRAVTNSLLDKMKKAQPPDRETKAEKEKEIRISVESRQKRLSLISIQI